MIDHWLLRVINVLKCVHWYDVGQLIYRDELDPYSYEPVSTFKCCLHPGKEARP